MMEILAPAGSILSLKAAIAGGANAVYLGLGEHNARIKSSDFDLNNLSEWVGYAHLFGVKVYVTVNTAVKNEEMPRIIELSRGAAKCGADALIVSDIGAAMAIGGTCDIPIHLSTQAGVQNAWDAMAVKGLGVKRLILSRETPLEDIADIKKQGFEVEVFAQGAMCVSFSGGCLLGSKIYGQSGNRGVCNQACRLNYTAKDETGKVIAEGRLLSPRDLKLGDKVKELSALGVDSIKIEGRLKRPVYVYAATKYYRDILDGKETTESLRALSESFNRGYFDGYTLCKSKPLIDTKTSSHIGVPIGRVLSVETRGGYKFAYVKSDYTLAKGDGVKILRNGVEVGGSDVTSVREEGGAYVIPVSDGVKKGDELRLTTNARAAAAAEGVKNTLPIVLTLQGGVGSPLALTATYNGITASINSESILSPSDSADNSAIHEKISKVGNTDFSIEKLIDRTESPVFIKVSEVNAMRRALLEKLRTEIILANTPRYAFFDLLPSATFLPKKLGTIVEISDLTSPQDYPFADAFVLSPNLPDKEKIKGFIKSVGNKKCYLRLPRVLRNAEVGVVKAFLRENEGLGVYTDNLYGVSVARELHVGYIAGFGLNVFNDMTASFFKDADAVCASVENPYSGDTAFRAGKVALMSFAHCPFSVAYGISCATCKDKDKLYYENGDARYLLLRRRTASCDFTMYEDKVTKYRAQNHEKNLFYRFVGLNEEEKSDMMKVVSEDIGE